MLRVISKIVTCIMKSLISHIYRHFSVWQCVSMGFPRSTTTMGVKSRSVAFGTAAKIVIMCYSLVAFARGSTMIKFSITEKVFSQTYSHSKGKVLFVSNVQVVPLKLRISSWLLSQLFGAADELA